MELSDYEDEEEAPSPTVQGGQGRGQGQGQGHDVAFAEGFSMEAQFAGVIAAVLKEKNLGFIRAKLPEKFARDKDVGFHFKCVQQLK